MPCTGWSITLALAFFLSAPLARAAVLYDGSLSGTPAAQSWNYIADDPTPLFDAVQATHSESGGVTTLDTTPDIQDRAGYFSEIPFFGTLKHPLLGTLDRAGDGYTVRIRARVVSEDHSGSTHRAGLSLIVLSSDSVGLELAFWEDEIWAQDDAPSLFVHDEGTAFDTTSAIVTYDLSILGSSYQVFADGVPILSGALRNYSAHSNPVYSETNFIFVGDDTTSARAQAEITYIEVLEQALAVPEPSTLSLAVLGLVLSWLICRRRAKLKVFVNCGALFRAFLSLTEGQSP